MFWIVFAAINLMLLFFITSFVCFYAGLHRSKFVENSDILFPEGEQYTPFKEEIIEKINYNKGLGFKEIKIKSFDKTLLYGRFYEAENKKAPLIIFFHGYRSSPFRDSAGVFDFYTKMGYSLLLVSQRAHEKSEGKYLTMGIKERKDCIEWVRYAEENIKESEKIILCGVSMGASTVLMAAGEKLPERVKGIISDSTFSSVKEIMKKVIGEMKLPRNTVYFFIRTGGIIFHQVNLDETNVKTQLKKAKIPIFFIHSKADSFVPYSMTEDCFLSYENQKEFFSVDDAGHGMSYFSDREGLICSLKNFIEKV